MKLLRQIFYLLALFTISLTVTYSQGIKETPIVRQVQIEKKPDVVQIFVQSDQPIDYQAEEKKTLPNAPANLEISWIGRLETGKEKRIRLMENGVWGVHYSMEAGPPPKVRLVIEMAHLLPYSIISSPDRKRLIIEITKEKGSTPPPPPTGVTPPSAKVLPKPPAPPSPGPQEGEMPREIRVIAPGVRTGRVNLELVNADLQDVLKALTLQTGASIVAVSDLTGKKVTLTLRDTPIESALEAVARASGLAFHLEDNTYYVGTADQIEAMFSGPTVTETYLLEKASAPDVKKILDEVFKNKIQVQTQGETVLVLTGPSQLVSKAKALLPSLDQPPSRAPVQPVEETTVEFYEVKYLNPEDLLIAAPGQQPTGTSGGGATLIQRLYPEVRIFPGPRAALPPRVSPIVVTGGVGGVGGAGGAAPPGGVGGEAGAPIPTATNLIAILGPKSQVEGALNLIKRLDIPVRQIEIQARVVDLNLDSENRLGISWLIDQTVKFEESPTKPSPSGQPARQGRNIFRFGTFSRTTLNLQATINALVTQGRGRILAEPRIVVTDGRPGSIFIGDQITFLTSRDITPTGTQISTSTILAGINLIVSAKSSPDGYITLDLGPSVSQVTGFTEFGGGVSFPQVATRSANTTVRIRDGDTVVIGGLFRDEETAQRTKLPLLGDLPLLGNLFRSRTQRKRHSEVVIFLTARILPDTGANLPAEPSPSKISPSSEEGKPPTMAK